MIVFLSGDNQYAIAQHIRRLRDEYAKKFTDSLEETVLDMSERTMADIEQALLAQPMFFSHRLVIIKRLEAVKIDPELLLTLLEKVPDSTVTIINGGGLDRRSKLFKSLAKLPGSKNYPMPNQSELITWMMRQAKLAGAELDRGVALHILKRTGLESLLSDRLAPKTKLADSTWLLAQEIQKLASGGGIITKQLVDDLVVGDQLESVFHLIEMISRHNPDKALVVFDELMQSGGNEQQILATLMWHYRTVALVVSGASAEELLDCGVKPFTAQKAAQQARGLSLADVMSAYQVLLDTDASIKNGIKKPHQAMTDLVLALSSIE